MVKFQLAGAWLLVAVGLAGCVNTPHSGHIPPPFPTDFPYVREFDFENSTWASLELHSDSDSMVGFVSWVNASVNRSATIFEYRSTVVADKGIVGGGMHEAYYDRLRAEAIGFRVLSDNASTGQLEVEARHDTLWGLLRSGVARLELFGVYPTVAATMHIRVYSNSSAINITSQNGTEKRVMTPGEFAEPGASIIKRPLLLAEPSWVQFRPDPSTGDSEAARETYAEPVYGILGPSVNATFERRGWTYTDSRSDNRPLWPSAALEAGSYELTLDYSSMPDGREPAYPYVVYHPWPLGLS